jgi:hypothetical protein
MLECTCLQLGSAPLRIRMTIASSQRRAHRAQQKGNRGNQKAGLHFTFSIFASALLLPVDVRCCTGGWLS